MLSPPHRNTKALERAATLAHQHSVRTHTYSIDITDPSAVKAGIAQVVADFGRLDVFIANAGTGDSKPLLEQSLESYAALMKTNVDGMVHCAKYAGEVFKAQGSGNLILTSSISAHIVNVPVDQPIYNGTKAFVSHLGKSLAREWREFARVNIVSPGFFDTKVCADCTHSLALETCCYCHLVGTGLMVRRWALGPKSSLKAYA
jgi:NAD(P)-dependent dehydrogenase (short-subunit alcohol dehydrogenase family)